MLEMRSNFSTCNFYICYVKEY